ncbi:MAG: CoB--CoM heterodisulfide reductase iron-sulfur subunit B family protein [Methanomassiliicoccales archaeon]
MSDEFYLFRGCLIPTRLPFLERSSLFILDKLGIGHEILPCATCCVEPIGLRSLALDTWLLTAARMLSIAEDGGKDILTLCNGCYVSLKEARHVLESKEERDRVNSILDEIGMEYKGTVDVHHLCGILKDMESRVRCTVVSPQGNLRMAVHSGCHIVRPSVVTSIDSHFSPHILSDIVDWVGSEVAYFEDWPKCCGGGISGISEDISLRVFEDSIKEFKRAKANSILTPCPFCFVQFDIKQKEGLPVLYISELLALAFGAAPESIGMKYHRTKVVV